jgi:tight adherence protein C
MTLAVLAGIGCGAALWLVVSGFRPAPPPLTAALARLADPPHRRTNGAGGTPAEDLDARLGVRLRRIPVVDQLMGRLAADMRILRLDPNRLPAELAAYGLVGLLWFPVVATGLRLMGVQIPVVIPVWLGLVGAVVAIVIPYRRIRKRAVEARAAFGHALSAFCDVAAIAMSAGREIHAALTEAAAAGHGRAFDELTEALHAGFLAGERPWEALAKLGRELDINDLIDLGGTIALAEEEGAPVVDTVASKARALRQRLVTDAERTSTAATERMALPGAMLMIGFLVFIGYPALHLILQEAR